MVTPGVVPNILQPDGAPPNTALLTLPRQGMVVHNYNGALERLRQEFKVSLGYSVSSKVALATK